MRKPFYNTVATIIGPMQVPTSPTVVVNSDCYIEELQISNPTGGSVTVNVQDGNGNSFIPMVPVASGGTISGASHNLRSTNDSPPGRFMPGGVTWSAGATGVTGYMLVWV